MIEDGELVMEEMHIAIVSSYEHLRYARVTIESICQNLKGVRIYILHKKWPINTEQLIEEISCRTELAGNKLIDKEIDDSYYHCFVKHNGYGRWGVEPLIRLSIMKIFEEITDRVLVLGTDTIINKNINELYFAKFEGNYLIAAKEMSIACKRDDLFWDVHKEFGYPKEKIINQNVNADVVLFNIKKIKKDNVYERFLEFFDEHHRNFPLLDQDVLNLFFMDSIKIIDPLLYNFIPSNYYGLDRMDRIKKAHIIHYAGSYKPWIGLYTEVYEKWWNFAKETPYYDTFIESSLTNDTIRKEFTRLIMYYQICCRFFDKNHLVEALNSFLPMKM